MTNRLVHAQSLYLRKHAENPIDWWSWGEEALTKAKTEDKPIFLSIGYSSCHWCTVMEGEAFSNLEIAAYLNDNFVPIKVDREERPDLDSIYMQALQLMTNQGGWPLNIFLSPGELIPFYGGTYFPIQPRYGRPGFLQILQSIQRFYAVEKEKLQEVKGEMLAALKQSTLLPLIQNQILNKNLLEKGIETSTKIINRHEYGNPSFPMIPYAELVERGSRFNPEAKQAAKQRGNDLALGGIYDHVGGGFHRYTVDSTWTVPHFEKMLYDNGQIVEYLANLWSAGITEPAYKQAIIGTVQWLKREMTAPQGYFYGSQDADSFTTPEDKEPEEGAFYVWEYEELEKILNPEELQEIQSQFTISPSGNFEGKNVLQRLHSGELSTLNINALAKLFKARYGSDANTLETFPPAFNNYEAKTKPWSGRIPAVTDPKMIVAWNSLMISGLARAYIVFNLPLAWQLAKGAAEFILGNQWVKGRFQRLNYEGQASVLAQAEDYALFIKALLDLHQASLLTGDNPENWFGKAVSLQQEFDEYLWSIELGGYYNAPLDGSSDLIIRERSYIDNATPAANGVAMANLIRLHLLTEKMSYLERAEDGIKAFGSIMEQSPQACPSLFTALDWYLHSTLIRTSQSKINELLPQHFPCSFYRLETQLPEDAQGLVCKGLACLPTARSSEQLLAQIQKTHGIS